MVFSDRLGAITIPFSAVTCRPIQTGLTPMLNVTGLTVEQNSFVGNTSYAIRAAGTLKAENNFFGGAAPPVGTPNGVTASVDADPFLAVAPAGCPTTTAAEIELLGNKLLIEADDVTPSLDDHTDFNSTKPTTGTVTRTFTINNIGGVDLMITSITKAGANPGDFTIGALNPASPIPAGGSASFDVSFTPGATGTRTATLTINNNDSDEGTFNFDVQGEGKNVLVVNTLDNVDDGTCDAVHCSLHEAIDEANSNPDADIIEFNIPGAAPFDINLTSNLPNITEPLTVDGSTQPGWSVGDPVVRIWRQNMNWSASNVDGVTIRDMDFSRNTNSGFDATAFTVTNCSNVVFENNRVQRRQGGIRVNSGCTDVIIRGNDFQGCGVNSNTPVVLLNDVQECTIPGGIEMHDNKYGTIYPINGNWRSSTVLHAQNMEGLVVGNQTVLGAHIVFEDDCGIDSVWGIWPNSHYEMLRFTNIKDLTIDNVDLSSTLGLTGNGIIVTSSSDITVKNCTIQHRREGMSISNSVDVRVFDNLLDSTGTNNTRAAIEFSNVTGDQIDGGVLAYGNMFGGATTSYTALYLNDMEDLIISDGSVPGTHITLEDMSGLTDVGRDDNYVLYLTNVTNLLIEDLDLHNANSNNHGKGIYVSNGVNHGGVTIRDCDITERREGIRIESGFDYTVIDNDFTHTGTSSNTRPAVYLNNLKGRDVDAGIAMSGNTWGGGSPAHSGISILNMCNLLVGDENVVGANIVIEDNSGFNTIYGNNDNSSGPLYFNKCSDIRVEDVDVSYDPGTRRDAYGMYANNCNRMTFLNNKVNHRETGIWCATGRDITVTGNDLRYTGSYINEPALYLNNIREETLPGGVSVSGNIFGGPGAEMGIRIQSMRDITISDGSIGGTNINLAVAGMDSIYGNGETVYGPLYANGVNNLHIENVDFSYSPGAERNSFAIYANNCNNVDVLNSNLSKRRNGLYVSGGSDFTVSNNDFSDCGRANGYAMYYNAVQAKFQPAAVIASMNSFGGTQTDQVLYVNKMRDFSIGDEFAGADIVIEDASGANNVNGINNSNAYEVVQLHNCENVEIDGLDLARPNTTSMNLTGIALNNSENIQVHDCIVTNRREGIRANNCIDVTIEDNDMRQSGSNTSEYALELENISGRTLTGGVQASGNLFGGNLVLGGIYLNNMENITIGDAGVGGANIVIEDASGLNNLSRVVNNGGYRVLWTNSIRNLTIDDIDVSCPSANKDFRGMDIQNCNNVLVQNCDISNHRFGVYFNGGSDCRLIDNDLTDSGQDRDEPIVWISNIEEEMLSGGFEANGNVFGGTADINGPAGVLKTCRTSSFPMVLWQVPTSPLSSPEVILKQLKGTDQAVLYFRNSANITVEALNLDFTGTRTGYGVYFENSYESQSNFTVQDCSIKNRLRAVYNSRGSDFTILNNDFTDSGSDNANAAIFMNFVGEGNLSGGLNIAGNTFGGTTYTAFRGDYLAELVVSRGTAPNTNVTFLDGDLENVDGTGIYLSNLSSGLITQCDLSSAAMSPTGTALWIEPSNNVEVNEVYFYNRDIGIHATGDSKSVYSFTCSAYEENDYGIDLDGNKPGSITVEDNYFNENNIAAIESNYDLTAEGNYWGDPTGPSNDGGMGNGYNGMIDAIPFETLTPTCACPITAPMTYGLNITHETCPPSNNGIIDISMVVEGLAPYVFSKDNGMNYVGSGNAHTFDNLPPGMYEVVIKETEGCTVTETVTVNNAIAPEIAVEGQGMDIVHMDDTPDTADDTDFGTVCESAGSVTHQFTIRNNPGLTDLIITDITSSDPAFTVSGISFPATIGIGMSTTFDLTFDPSMGGATTATITVENNGDCDEYPFVFDVRGTANVVDGGAIDMAQGVCFSDPNPGEIESQTNGTGSGTITYRWEMSTTDCNSGWMVVPGAEDPSYDPPGPMGTTTYYKRITISTLNGVVCEAESNCHVSTLINGFDVDGTIIWSTDNISGVNLADVEITGDVMAMDVTDVNGEYDMMICPGGDMDITPRKNINFFNGIGVNDALAIQLHLTGTMPISDPYVMVAADVDHSDFVSTFDALLLKQGLLANPLVPDFFDISWRFVPQTHTMMLPPWGFPEKISLTGVAADASANDFYGMKVGDIVAGYATPGTFAGTMENLVWRVQDRLLESGEQYTIAFTADELENLAAWQFALRFDPSVLQFDSLTVAEGLPFSPDDFGLFELEDGLIRSVWTNVNGVNFDNATEVFYIHFTALASGDLLSEILDLDSEVLAPHVYDPMLMEADLLLNYAPSTGTQSQLAELLGLTNNPNPFESSTTAAFYLPKACDAQLRVTDINGREIMRINKTLAAGYHQEVLNLGDVTASGVLNLELITPYGVLTRKMVRVGK